MTQQNDKYQERYLAHQGRKAKMLKQIMEERHSDRVFGDAPVDEKDIDTLIESIYKCPSSCDRKAISHILVSDRDEKALLSGLLVGGTGWIHRAPNILLLFADPTAYKAGDEIKFMPYLDAGVVVEQLYLMATALELKACFVNPNIREMSKKHFTDVFGDGIFCGAFVFGKE